MTELIGEIFRTQGRVARPLAFEIRAELTREDLAAMAGAEKGSEPSAIKRLTDRHHALARNLAGGMGEGEAAIVCGLSLSRVSILKSDPAFRELLEFYRGEVNLVYQDMHQKLAGIAETALDELHDRLAEEPETVGVGQLMELVKLGADRTGYGPQSSTTNLNVNVGLADRLKQARLRVAERRALPNADE